MTGLVFLHGWGFGASTWDRWLADFGSRPLHCLDAGYYGPANLSLPENPNGWIGIGHSLGFARLAQFPIRWKALVGLGAFLHFCPTAQFPTGTPAATLDSMTARLDISACDVLARFQKRCGLKIATAPSPTPEGLTRLRTDLLALRDLDMAPLACPTLLLHAKDDRIAPVVLAEEAHKRTPGARLTVLETGGHALHLIQHEFCAQQVREFLHELG